MIRFPNPRLNPHPSTIHTLAPRWCRLSLSLSLSGCPVLSVDSSSSSTTHSIPQPSLLHRKNHCCNALPDCSQRASARQSRTRSLTGTSLVRWLDSAQPTLASHRNADWPSAACSPWSRLDQLLYQTPLAASATLATRYFTSGQLLLGLHCSSVSRHVCDRFLIGSTAQAHRTFPSSLARLDYNNTRLRSRHRYRAVELPCRRH